MKDFVIRFVPKLGYLPIIIVDGEEVYRGEYKKTPEQALKAAINFATLRLN